MLDLSNPGQPVVVVSGLARGDLSALTRANLSREAWSALLRVTVKSDGGTAATAIPVAGAYAIADGSIRFTPMFPLDPGRQYDVVFDPAALPGAGLGDMPKVSNVVSTPPPPATPDTRIAAIYPSGPTVPSNLLRMYVEFSGPMGSRGGQDYISIADGNGGDIPGALLPLDTDLWNGDRTRFTVLFDPGRVKRGILPNRAMGRPLTPGMTFTITVKRDWPDAHGKPLAAEFRKEYRVGPPIERALSTTAWQIQAPAAGSRDPLVVTFGWGLDHALLQRAMRVKRDLGSVAEDVPGEVRVGGAETQWTFVPGTPWQPGKHLLIADAFLEDPSGNRYYIAFEEESGASPRYGAASLPLTIR